MNRKSTPSDAGTASLPRLLNGTALFLKYWGIEYPKAVSNNSKFLWLCGLRYQLAILMAVMIGLVYLSANYAVQSTVLYTKDQKLSDLAEECNATTNKVALLLQQGYAEALTTYLQPAASSPQSTYPSQFFDSVSIVPVSDEDGHRSEQAWYDFHFDAPAFPQHPRWSHFYWEDAPQEASGENVVTESTPTISGPRAFINLYLNEANGQTKILKCEVTKTFKNELRSTRTLILIANSINGMDGKLSRGRNVEIAVTPTGVSTPEDALDNSSEEGNSILSTAQKATRAWERYYKDSDNRQLVRQRQEREAILYPDKEQAATAVSSTDLAGMQLKKRGGRLYFCVAVLPNPESFKDSSFEESKQAEFRIQRASLEDRLKDFEKHILESLDPYAVILPYDHFRQVRLRSSNSEVLEQLKNFVEHELGLFETVTNRLRTKPVSTDIQLTWRQTELDNFVVAVNKLTFTWPALNKTATTKSDDAGSQDLAYVMRAASIDEIEFSASKSIDGLQWLTLMVAVLVAMVTFGAATYLTRPLSKIESIAKEIGRHGFSPDAKLEQHIHSLLEQLPTARRDEVGTLSKQFKETTEQVLRANKELRESKDREMAEQRKNEQAERNKAIADEVSQAVMLLLASVSHDMRQPLNPIFFYTERLLQKPNLNDDDRRALSKILRSARGLSFLVEDILDYKRILAGDVVLSVDDVDVETMLGDLKEDYAPMAQTRGTTISISNEWQGTLHSDGNRLKRVLNNLISNACKATQKGSINLRIVPYGIENVEISVRDTGCGMEDSVKRLLFESPERQVELARQYGVRHNNKDPNSTRIGLFVCKQLIEAMGGTIQCFSEVGKGSEFVVRLPVRALTQPTTTFEVKQAVQPATHVTTQPTTQPTTQVTTITTAPAKCLGRALVIDDDPRCTEILAQLLNGLGYEVEQILDPQVGLDRAIASPPDLITLDVYMPGLDGWEVLRELKDNPRTTSTTVIMVTIDPSQEKATLLGADGFVNKPIDPSQFTTAVWQAISHRQGANVLVVDDDPECRRQLIEILAPLGCHILEGVDGEDAMEKLAELGNEPLDLAIVDLYMPNMDGFCLIDQLRQKTATKDSRIIILSGGVLSESERKKLFRQADQFFSKGTVNLNTLRQEIQNILAHRLQQANNKMELSKGGTR